MESTRRAMLNSEAPVATITCARCGQERDQMERAPLSGSLGQSIQAQTCEQCWREWREESLRLINHLGIQPVDPSHRARLYEFMREFLRLEPAP